MQNALEYLRIYRRFEAFVVIFTIMSETKFRFYFFSCVQKSIGSAQKSGSPIEIS